MSAPMKRIRGSEHIPRPLTAPAVALGNFDGVHIAHQRLIALAQGAARRSGGTSVVYTFDPHPARVLASGESPPLLQTLPQRLATIEAQGVDCCVIEPFTMAFAAQGAERFFEEILVGRLEASSLVVGYDFTFGLRRHGTVEILRRLSDARGIALETLDAQFEGETLISSTTIRRALAQGDVTEAAALLGRPYLIEGRVVPGRGIGRTLGARTANIESVNELIPKDGVYLTQTTVGEAGLEQRRFDSITSIGHNPTFLGAPFAVETHLIDIDVTISGQIVSIDFLERMRDQVAFESPERLREQIGKDIDAARMKHRARGMRHEA